MEVGWPVRRAPRAGSREGEGDRIDVCKPPAIQPQGKAPCGAVCFAGLRGGRGCVMGREEGAFMRRRARRRAGPFCIGLRPRPRPRRRCWWYAALERCFF